MCLAVPPWTMVLMVFLDCKELRRKRKEFISRYSVKHEQLYKNTQSRKGRQLLNAKNLQDCPRNRASSLLLEDNNLQDHHKKKLGFIWCMSLVCGICSEQVMDQSKNSVCSLIRRMTSPLEIISIILTYPVPAVLAMHALVISLYTFPNSNIQSEIVKTRITCLTLSLFYLISILPSLLVDLMNSDTYLILVLFIKYNLSSIHVIFEPLVLIYMRPSLVTNLRITFKRVKPYFI